MAVTKGDLTVAKINAALKILEWSKDDIEPGIGGTPTQLYVALAEAFKSVYQIVSESIEANVGEDETTEVDAEKVPAGAIA